MDESLGLLIRLVFGTIFLAAGSYKLSDLGEFADAIRLYRLIPGATAGAAAKMVAVTEASLGVTLLLGAAIPVAGRLGAALLVIFALAIAINLIRGRRIPCGCKRAAEPIQVKHIVRNLAGVAALLLLVDLPAHPWSLDRLALLSFPK